MRRDDVYPPFDAVKEAVERAIREDTAPLGDVTAMLIDADIAGLATFVSRDQGVLAGTKCAIESCAQIDSQLRCTFSAHDGDQIEPGQILGVVEGPMRSIVTAERTALNFLSHLSGVATLTRKFVDQVVVANPNARIWDTRKTTPGLRALQKAAVRAGGGVNHRGNLSEGVLIKDNHLGHLGIAEAVHRARDRWPGRMIEVECDRHDQITEALDAGATIVLLDNMSIADVAIGVKLVRDHERGKTGAVLVEASGGVTLENVAAFAAAGVDLISVGALTHSSPILDIGLDL